MNAATQEALACACGFTDPDTQEDEPFHKCAKCNGETTRGRAYCDKCSPFKGEES
jgi:hypothetical protein